MTAASREEAGAAFAATGAFNELLVADGHVVFAGGLHSASTATSARQVAVSGTEDDSGPNGATLPSRCPAPGAVGRGSGLVGR